MGLKSRAEIVANQISKTIDRNNKDIKNMEEKNLNKEYAVMFNKVLGVFLDKLWESNRRYLNLDRATWQVKIPVPWSSKNYSEYGLTRTKADILKKIVQKREEFFLTYIDDEKRYYVANGYEHMYNSYLYLIRNPITEEEVKNAKSN